MNIHFFKYQAQGNDFILIDDRKNNCESYLNNEKVKNLCNRNFGIGADGILIIKNLLGYDFEIIYLNSDGTKSFCSNGSRCVINYMHSLDNKDEYIFKSYDGVHKAVVKKGEVELEMKVSEIKIKNKRYFINTGAPHLIEIVDNFHKIDVEKIAKELKNSLEEDVNVTFLSLINKNSTKKDYHILATSFEKGVEEETLSCGTGAVAASICANIKYNLSSPIKIQMKGGNLEVRFDKNDKNNYSNIFIKGQNSGKKVFQGTIKI